MGEGGRERGREGGREGGRGREGEGEREGGREREREREGGRGREGGREGEGYMSFISIAPTLLYMFITLDVANVCLQYCSGARYTHIQYNVNLYNVLYMCTDIYIFFSL